MGRFYLTSEWGRLKQKDMKGVSWLETVFQFDELGTNYRREIIGGLTTFLSMAYILFVNPITLALVSVPDFPDKLRIDQGQSLQRRR